jgi:hypothetical protein
MSFVICRNKSRFLHICMILVSCSSFLTCIINFQLFLISFLLLFLFVFKPIIPNSDLRICLQLNPNFPKMFRHAINNLIMHYFLPFFVNNIPFHILLDHCNRRLFSYSHIFDILSSFPFHFNH